MPLDRDRLLMNLDRTMRLINQQVIHPEMPELATGDIEPFIRMVARVRATYLRALFDVAREVGGALPTPDQISRLRELRLSYEECIAGTKAIETAIKREYLDVKQD